MLPYLYVFHSFYFILFKVCKVSKLQRAGREWYHHHHSPYSHSDGGYSSPSPPLDDDEREKVRLNTVLIMIEEGIR